MRCLFLVCTLFLVGCSQVHVSHDYDASVQFANYLSYSWREKEKSSPYYKDIRENNPLLLKRFFHAINETLQAKGYVKRDQSDFVISYDFSVKTRLDTTPASPRIGFGIGSHYRYGGVGFYSGTEIHQYDVGILTIDFFDRRTGNLIWRGTGSDVLSTHSSPDKSAEMAMNLVESVLAQFPPGY